MIHESGHRVLAGDNPFEVTAESGSPHPAPVDVPLWNETFFFSAWSPVNGVGYFIHAGSDPADPALRFAQVIAYLPDGRLVTNRSWGRPSGTGDELTIGGFTMTTVEPLKAWRIRFDGAGELTTSTESGRRPVGAGFAVPLSFDVEVTAAAPVWDLFAATGMPRLDWASIHLEQNLYTNGTLTAGSDTWKIDGVGFRDHSVGARSFDSLGGDRFWGFVSPTTGRSCQGIMVWARDGELRLASGSLHDNGTTEVINGDLSLTGLTDTTGDPKDLELTLVRPSGEKIVATGRIEHTVTITIADPNHNINGALLEGDPLILSESQTRWEWPDGDVLYGHLERVARLSTLTRRGVVMAGPSKLRLLGKAAVVAGSIVVEKVRKPVARTRDDIPVTGMEITREWLQDVLCHDHPGARIESFELIAGTSQTTSRAAVRVTYNDEGTRAGLPTKLFTKTTTGFGQRLMIGGAQMLEGETKFYTVFRPRVDMEAPLGYWGAADQRSWRSMILMEDIAETRGATFVEPLTPLTSSQIDDVVVSLANCHGALWDDPDLRGMKTTRDHLANVSGFAAMGSCSARGIEKASDLVSPGVRGQAHRLWAGTTRQLTMLTTEHTPTLLHGDTHVGQVYLTREGRAGLTDWQSIMVGGWGFDFSYFVGTACTPEERRARERDLLELYLSTLTQAGGKAPSFDDAWLIYRQCMAYPCSAWSFVYGRAFYQPEMQPDEACREEIRRLTIAVDELDTLDALGV
jgi:hypothetical protein